MADIANRAKIESEFAKRLAKLSGRHKAEFLDLAGRPPDLSKVPESFYVRVQRETTEEMAALLLFIFISSATQHGADEDASTQAALAWSGGTAGQAAADWTQGTRDGLARMAAKLADARQRGIPFDVQEPLTTIFGPSRVERVAISMTTDATTSASEFAVDHQGLSDADDRWVTEDDQKVCPICRPLHLKRREVWSAKFPTGPPAHERCRCYIEYRRSNLLGRNQPAGTA